LSEPSASESTEVEAESLGQVLGFMRLLWAVAHGLESTSKRMGSSLGVTGPQRLVVRLLGHYGELSPGDLADLLHVHPSSLTGVLGRLARSKLLERRRDPNDGRRAILSLTPKGKALNARRAGTVEAAIRRVLQAQPRAKLAATQDVLVALARELDPEPDATPAPPHRKAVKTKGASAARGARRGPPRDR
jgi:MarR family transcriptional regulator, organic hydroperoxide resistance regulator